MSSEIRRSRADYSLLDGSGGVLQSGDAEAVIGDDELSVGPVTVSFLDADTLVEGDYRIELGLWPEGRLVMTGLGRRHQTFYGELRRSRNQARVAGFLAHGVTMPDRFVGAVRSGGRDVAAEFQIYETHVTIVPDYDGDPWQLAFGAITNLRSAADPPSIIAESSDGPITFSQLARQRESFLATVSERVQAQRDLLEEITGQPGFSDGLAIGRDDLGEFESLVERFTAPERLEGSQSLLRLAGRDARLGFVQLLDPDSDRLRCAGPLPENWAAFLLAPVGSLTAMEILSGPAAATYVFAGEPAALNRDLQLLHFRRAPLALTDQQALLTPDNPYRLALRRLQPLQRLRSATRDRLVHNEGWSQALNRAMGG